MPAGGALCSQTIFFNGWPSIFYISAFTGFFFSFLYIIIGADKPSKQVLFINNKLINKIARKKRKTFVLFILFFLLIYFLQIIIKLFLELYF